MMTMHPVVVPDWTTVVEVLLETQLLVVLYSPCKIKGSHKWKVVSVNAQKSQKKPSQPVVMTQYERPVTQGLTSNKNILTLSLCSMQY